MLRDGTALPVLFDGRSVLAIDKPRGWLTAPSDWDRTDRNLQSELERGIGKGERWARSRGLRYLRYVHRLDADTTGILLLAKSLGALRALSSLFVTRGIEKVYLAVVEGRPRSGVWTCEEPIAEDPACRGRMIVSRKSGKDAVTSFEVIESGSRCCVVAVRPLTGRTHQIRVHLARAGVPVAGDRLYGKSAHAGDELGLRAVGLSFRDPFERRQVEITAPVDKFLARYGFTPKCWQGGSGGAGKGGAHAAR